MRRKALTAMISFLMATTFTLGVTGCSPSKDTGAGTNTNKESAGTSKPKPAEKTVLKFWTFHTNYEKDWMSNLAAEYNKKNTNVEVQYESIPQADYMGSKLTTAFAANEGPDVFVISSGDFLKYVNGNVAKDLTSYFTDNIKNDFLKSSLDAVTVNNKIYAVPFEIELLGLYYDKDMLAKANVQPPKTWNELIEATKKLTTDKVAGLMVEPSKGYYQNFTWYPFMWQGGGNVIDEASKKGTFEGPAVENALQLWGDLVKAGAPSKTAKLTTEPLIGEGATAMQVSGTWMISRFEKDFADKNIGVVPLPIPDGGKAATSAGGWKFMVNGKSEKSDEAAKFVMWALAEDIEMPLKWCTDVKFAYSPRKSVMEAGKDIYSKGLRKIFTDEIYKTAIGEPRYPAEVVDAAGDAIQEVMFKGTNAKEAAKKANDKINEILKSFEGSL